MKKTIKNIEIEKMLKTLVREGSFITEIKMPQKLRQAIRVNRKVLMDRYAIYQEGRKEIIDKYVADGYAHKEGSMIRIEDAYRPAFMQECFELENVSNELEFERIDNGVLEEFLGSHDLTLDEEDFLLYFEE